MEIKGNFQARISYGFKLHLTIPPSQKGYGEEQVIRFTPRLMFKTPTIMCKVCREAEVWTEENKHLPTGDGVFEHTVCVIPILAKKKKKSNGGWNWMFPDKSTTHPQYILWSSLDLPETLRHYAAQRVAAEATDNLAKWWVGAQGVRSHSVHSDPLHFVHTDCHLLEFYTYDVEKLEGDASIRQSTVWSMPKR